GPRADRLARGVRGRHRAAPVSDQKVSPRAGRPARRGHRCARRPRRGRAGDRRSGRAGPHERLPVEDQDGDPERGGAATARGPLLPGVARRRVHHGNGTAATFQSDPDVFTFSMHQERNYPAWKPPSDVDIGLEDGTGDTEYLSLLERHLPDLVARDRPDLVFYLAGADPYQFDQLGGLGLTLEALRRRDALVFERATRAGVAVAVCLAGGYAVRTDDTVAIHCNTVRAAREAMV